ncbi:MAG: hypothetical protein PHW31_02765 [Candidatus Pacebacteria bacterium]|nr:hypothetical protein [Candidatus Paceibacterota bacterium]
MKQAPLPTGCIRVKCKYCNDFHDVRVDNFLTCPTSCESGFGGYYIAVDKNSEVKQTDNFENVKIFLNLQIIKL